MKSDPAVVKKSLTTQLESRELDCLAAEKVMGWKRVTSGGSCDYFDAGGVLRRFLPSLHIEDAVQVLETFECWQTGKIGDGKGYWCRIVTKWDGDDIAEESWQEEAETLTEAIAKCSLRARGVEIE
jgi:hypothetical protein